MKSNRNRGYLLTDIGRVFKKKETYIGMIGVAAALFFSISSDLQESVISNFLYGTYGVGFLLSFVFCAFSYGTIYSDELETYYIRYSVIRGGLKKLLVLAVPVFCYQIITEFSAKLTEKNSMWSIQSVFDARYRMFGNDGKMFLWALGLSLCITAFLCGASYIRLKNRM